MWFTDLKRKIGLHILRYRLGVKKKHRQVDADFKAFDGMPYFDKVHVDLHPFIKPTEREQYINSLRHKLASDGEVIPLRDLKPVKTASGLIMNPNKSVRQTIRESIAELKGETA